MVKVLSVISRCLLLLVVTLLMIVSTSYAQEGVTKANIGEKNILILLSSHPLLPLTDAFLEGVREANLKNMGKLNIYIECIESASLSNSLDYNDWLAFLSQKYQHIRFDAAIAESDYASKFLSTYGERFLGEIPNVHFVMSQREGVGYGKGALAVRFDNTSAIKKTVEIAEVMNPGVRDFVLIKGATTGDGNGMQATIDILRSELQENNNNYVSVISGYTEEELYRSVAVVPSDSVIFYTPVMRDKSGKRLIPREVLKKLVKVSKAPIYTFWSPLVDTGIVGGYIHDTKALAISMIDAAITFIDTGAFDYQDMKPHLVVDWNAVAQHNIDPKTIPADSHILNKPLPIFETHSEAVMMATMVFIASLLSLTIYWLRKQAAINEKLEKTRDKVLVEKNKAENMARTDYLSGLDNRRSFFEKGDLICSQTRRLNKPLSLLAIDIDDFKKINDNFGHAVGDEVIKTVAHVINRNKRDTDISARFGGEEFVVLASFSDIDGAKYLAERIRGDIEEVDIYIEGQEVKCTVSIGVCMIHSDSEDCMIVNGLKEADKALYQAKNQGKNQVVISTAFSVN